VIGSEINPEFKGVTTPSFKRETKYRFWLNYCISIWILVPYRAGETSVKSNYTTTYKYGGPNSLDIQSIDLNFELCLLIPNAEQQDSKNYLFPIPGPNPTLICLATGW